MDDAVVSIGLFLFGVGLLVCFCVAMLILSVVFAVDYILALVVVGLFAVPAAALFWVVIETVLSSSNVVAFCFMEVIGALWHFWCVVTFQQSGRGCDPRRYPATFSHEIM